MGRTLVSSTLLLLCSLFAFATQPQNNKPTLELMKQHPLVFEENRGQVDPSVRYAAHARQSGIFFAASEVILALYPPNLDKRSEATSVRLRWIDGNPSPSISAEVPLQGKVNYLRGRDVTKWHTDIPTYSRVRYRQLYHGVSAIFYGKDGMFEYDLEVAPHTDWTRIRFAYDGVRSLSLAANGDLLLKLRDGELRQHLPKVHQQIDGRKRLLAASYVINADNSVGYRIEGVDRDQPLTIDPVLSYSTYIGSSTADSVNAIAVDQFGRAYVTGTTVFGFPTKNPAMGNGLSADAFVTKFWATGGGLIYSTYLGGDSADAGSAIAVDRFGNAYVGGDTFSPNFPVTPGAYQSQFVGAGSAFVTKLSPSGSSLVYSLLIGGEEGANLNALALDSQQRVYITGETSSSGFPVKNAFQSTYNSQPPSSGGVSAFVTRFNNTGSDLEYSTYLDGFIASGGFGIAVDSTFHAYVTGFTSSPNFPTTPGAFQRTFKAATIPDFPHDIPGTSAFVTKFSADGTTLNYSTFLGGTSSDFAYAIAVDTSDRAYVTGRAQSTDFPIKSGGFQTTNHGASDAFVTKLQKDGAGLIYSTFLGGSSGEVGTSIAVDGSGYAYVVGGTSSSNFPTRNPIQSTFRGVADAFITRLSTGGGSLIYSTFLGGTKNDSAMSVRLDSAGAAYVGGITSSTNFPTTPGAYSRTLKGDPAKGDTDGWVAKIKP